MIYKSGKEVHASGIFSMDVHMQDSKPVVVCTGSKDKSVAVSEWTPTGILRTTWRSTYHSSKVGAAKIQPSGHGEINLVSSASDDGRVAIHDVRATSVVASLNVHPKPHSVEWNPLDINQFITGGLDDTIYLFDLRNSAKPLRSFRGHVPTNSLARGLKSIHHPMFYLPSSREHGMPALSSAHSFILVGGEGSGSLSIYKNGSCCTGETACSTTEGTVYSRGLLPDDCGDAGSIAILVLPRQRSCEPNAVGSVVNGRQLK